MMVVDERFSAKGPKLVVTQSDLGTGCCIFWGLVTISQNQLGIAKTHSLYDRTYSELTGLAVAPVQNKGQ